MNKAACLFKTLFSKKGKSKEKSSNYKSSKTMPSFMKYAARNPHKSKIQIRLVYKNQLFANICLDKSKASSLSCDWLLKEAQSRFKNADSANGFATEFPRIVALKTVPTSLAIDYWLTLPTGNLGILPNKLTLEPIIYEGSTKYTTDFENRGKVSLTDFEVCGLIGRGAFAKVYLGISRLFEFTD